MCHDVAAHTMREYSKWPLFVIFGSLHPGFNLKNEKIDAVFGILTQKVGPSRSSEAKTVHSCNLEKIRKFFKKWKVRSSCGCISPHKEEPAFNFFWFGDEFKFAAGLLLLFDLNCMNVELFGVLCGNIFLGTKINSDLVNCAVSDTDSAMLDAVYLVISK